MKLTDYLRTTLNEMLDLYGQNFRKYFRASIYFTLISALVSMILAFFLFVIVYRTTDSGDFFPRRNFLDAFWAGSSSFQNVVASLMILSFCLFGIFILKQRENPKAHDFSPGILMRSVPTAAWGFVICLALLVLILNGFLYYPLEFYWFRDNWAMFYWVQAMINLVKDYLPFILSMWVIIAYYHPKGGFKFLPRYKQAFISSLLLSFLFYEGIQAAIHYLNRIVFSLVFIPFRDATVPVIIIIPVMILLVSVFVPAFSAIIAFPFRLANKNFQPAVDNRVG